jgi:acetone carboxylase gamma subunit
MRKRFEELNELCKKLNTDRLWSWSRVNCTHNSLYEYFLKYIAHEKEDRADSIYTVTGGISHDIIEKFYSGEITKEQMLEEFEDGWVTAFDISELKFNRSDSEKNNDIADKYYKNLEHFFKNHTVLKNKVALEQFITIKIGDEYYQGYIDALTTDDEKNYVIIDWKTSSIYVGEKAKNECGQLVMYAMGLHQKGIPYEKIRICWNFLKYQNITVHMKNGTSKVRQIERAKIGESLTANAKMWLKAFGYEEQLMEYLDALVQTNDITVLPKEVQEKYICEDCYVYVDLTEELLQHWEDYIIETTKMIRDKEAEYEISKDESIWMESQEDVAKNSFYFANLCSYSANKHKPYKIYLDNLEKEKNGDIFGNKPKTTETEEEDDMSWLADLI